MSKMCLVYVVTEDENEAKNIAKKLLKKKLIACANIIDNMQSLYFWPPEENEIQEADETILLLKTLKENFSEINHEILDMHSYETPCIFSIDIDDVDSNFLGWMKHQLK